MIYFFIRSIFSEIKMNKVNRQKGFSQIILLVIISFLAVALPVTIRLVQKSQENRSSAATESTYSGGGCSSYTGPSSCNAVKGCIWDGIAGLGVCRGTPETPGVTPINGACGNSKDVCSAGTYQDATDTPSNYYWNCLGINGGTNKYGCNADRPRGKSCTWAGTTILDGESQCFNALGGSLGSQMIKCTDGKTSVVKNYPLVKDCVDYEDGCKWGTDGTVILNGQTKCMNILGGVGGSQLVKCENNVASVVGKFITKDCTADGKDCKSPDGTVWKDGSRTCTGRQWNYCSNGLFLPGGLCEVACSSGHCSCRTDSGAILNSGSYKCEGSISITCNEGNLARINCNNAGCDTATGKCKSGNEIGSRFWIKGSPGASCAQTTKLYLNASACSSALGVTCYSSQAACEAVVVNPCKVGEQRCSSSSSIQECKATNTGATSWVTTGFCSSDKTCTMKSDGTAYCKSNGRDDGGGGGGTTPVCTANTVSTTECYDSTHLKKCNSDGTAWIQGDQCPTNQACQNGVCGGVGAKLSFKFAFDGVAPANLECLDNFKTVTLTVGKVGTTLVQEMSTNVTKTDLTNSKGYAIFGADNVALGTGFSGASNVYVKIKGQVHARMYYCVKSQSAKNTSQICNLSLDGTVNNFYEYPVLAGDVDQNGVVNTADFSVIKTALFTTGCGVKTDLNGDGIVNEFDVKLFKVALEAKYDE